MGHSRARRPIGPMVDCLQPSASNPRIHDQVPPNPNSSAPSSPTNINENTTGGSPTQPPMKKKRGPSWPIKDWGTGKKLDIKLNNYNQPIGENASKLATQLGVIARNETYCPIIYNDWRCRQLCTYKERIWKEVKDNCNVSDLYKRICLQSVGRKWRNWKDELKLRHYDIFDNDEERLAITPERVQDDQWKVFVQYQGTDRAKEAMEKKFKEVPDSQHTPEFLEKVFTDVLGCDTHGRVRTHGLGPSPTQVFGKKCNHQEQHVHDLERAREEGRQERD